MIDIKELLAMQDTPSISVTMTVGDFEELIKQTVVETVKSFKNTGDPTIVWLTPKQVCERLSKDRATLWRWDKEGYLKGHKFGNRVRYRLCDVERVEVAER